jgi:hypothetical protein
MCLGLCFSFSLLALRLAIFAAIGDYSLPRPKEGALMSDKVVTRMTDPEYKVECDGKETCVMCNGVKLAIRRGCQSNPASQFATSSKTADMGLR